MPFLTGDSRRRRGPAKESASSADVAIVGAGPGGLLAAARLATKFSVVVADSNPIGAGKRCAGLLSAEALSYLPGIDEDKALFQEPAELEVIPVIGGRRMPGRAFRNVDRGALQAWMAARAEKAGALLVRTSLKSISAARRSWNLVFEDEKLVLAPIVIGADGVNSTTRRALGIAKPPIVAARQAFYEGKIDKAYLVLDRDAAGLRYRWAVPKRGGVLIGATMEAGEDISTAFPEQALREVKMACPGLEVGARIAEERGAFTRIRSLDDISLGLPGAFLIGEAAGLVLPSSGEGLGGALASAASVSTVLLEAGTAGAGLGRSGSAHALEGYRHSIAPRIDAIAADLSFLERLEVRGA